MRAYHQLWRIGTALRMSIHRVQAGSIYQNNHESMGARLAVVYWAMVVSHHGQRELGFAVSGSGNSRAREVVKWYSRIYV